VWFFRVIGRHVRLVSIDEFDQPVLVTAIGNSVETTTCR